MNFSDLLWESVKTKDADFRLEDIFVVFQLAGIDSVVVLSFRSCTCFFSMPEMDSLYFAMCEILI